MLQNLVIKHSQSTSDFNQILFTLRKSFIKGKVKTCEIEWFTMLFKHFSDNLISTDDDILEIIIQSINFKEAKLTENVLQLLWLMAGKHKKLLNEVILTILKKLRKEKSVETGYVNNIIDIMCTQIEPKVVFSEFALEIRKFNDIIFVGFMVETLDLILGKLRLLRE